jgi:hypothetical protein
MTVKELIEKLQTVEPDRIVTIATNGGIEEARYVLRSMTENGRKEIIITR